MFKFNKRSKTEQALKRRTRAEVMINYDNIDIYKEKQNIPGETVAQLSEPPELKRNSQNEIEREKTKLADEVMDAVQTRNITEDNKYN